MILNFKQTTAMMDGFDYRHDRPEERERFAGVLKDKLQHMLLELTTTSKDSTESFVTLFLVYLYLLTTTNTTCL